MRDDRWIRLNNTYYRGGPFSKSEIILLLGYSICYIGSVARGPLVLILQRSFLLSWPRGGPRQIFTQYSLSSLISSCALIAGSEYYLKQISYMLRGYCQHVHPREDHSRLIQLSCRSYAMHLAFP